MRCATALLRYDRGSGWSGPVNTIEIDDQWASRLASTYIDIDYENWRIAVVIDKAGSTAEIGFSNGTTGTLPRSIGVHAAQADRAERASIR